MAYTGLVMRRLWIFLAISLGLCCILIIAIAGFGINAGLKVLNETKGFATETIKAIAQPWSKAEFTNRSAPELIASPSSMKTIDGLFAEAPKKLGNIEKFDVGTPGITSKSSTGKPTEIRAAFVFKANFEKGTADVQLILIRRDKSNWQIAGFDLSHVTQSGGQAKPASPKPKPGANL